MKRTTLILAVTASAVSLLIAAGTGMANDAANVYRFPVVADLTDPCTGENFTFSGTVVFVVSQFTSAGGLNHLSVAQAWQDVSGVNSSGTMYRLVNSGMGEQQNPPPGGGSVTTTQTFRVISQTSSDNFILNAFLQVVVADGQLVLFNNTFTTKCVG